MLGLGVTCLVGVKTNLVGTREAAVKRLAVFRVERERGLVEDFAVALGDPVVALATFGGCF